MQHPGSGSAFRKLRAALTFPLGGTWVQQRRAANRTCLVQMQIASFVCADETAEVHVCICIRVRRAASVLLSLGGLQAPRL